MYIVCAQYTPTTFYANGRKIENMANAFCPMRVIVTGETPESGFLPDRNYVQINGKNYPLGHCFTLELPLGSCQLEVHTPPPNTIHRASTVVKENQLYALTLTVDASRNITGASFGVEDITEDPWGLYANDCKRAVENREKIAQWRRSRTPEPAPSPTPTTTRRGGGKAIGWGLVLTLFFGLGIVLCCTGNIELETTVITEGFALSNMAVYIGGAVIGLITLISGLLIRKADS